MTDSAANKLAVAGIFAASADLSDPLTSPFQRADMPVTGAPAAGVQRTIVNTDGDDTFVIEKSEFGGTTIIAATAGSGLQRDIVRFGAGIDPADLRFTRNGTDLQISIAGSGGAADGDGSSQVLIIRDFFLTTSAIDAFVFADGSAILGADIWHQIIPNALVAESTPTAGGGHRDIVIDGAQTEPFTSVVTEYGASGALLTQTQFLDNGTLSGTIYDPAGRVLTGGVGADSLIGGDGNDTLQGGAGNDVLQGGAGNDVMDGGAGADRMAGGTGSDAYYVDSLTDVVLERPNEGADAVFVSVSGFVLPDNVENGVITTTHGLTLTGNGLNNVLQGNVGDDVLIGGAGNDVLMGEGGRDGLVGGTGNDVLDGGAGADRMVGGAGNDAYYVDDLADAVVENPNEGTDAAFVSVSGYTLASNVENGVVIVGDGVALSGNELDNVLQGNAGADTLNGGAGNDFLMGDGGNDTLQGGAGNDVLDGGDGDDRMVGGAGNDAYVVDSLSDVIVENASEGADAAFVSVSGYVLAANVENGVVNTTTGITLSGNALDNNLQGNVGDDVLTGGGGNDTFVFRRGGAHDTATDFSGGAGLSDTVALSGFGNITSFTDVLSHATQVGADTVIDFGGGDQLVLQNVLRSSLVADDFRFI
ncbi:MAG: calcium-binding protein [Xanthobacteraceae bacterium]